MTARTALVAAALLALAACTSAQDAAPATQAAPSTTATDSAGVNCDDAPQDVVATALGLRLQHSRQAIRDTVVTCTYDGGGAVVRFRTGADAASFAEGRGAQDHVEDVPGFHDEAYRATTTRGEVVQTVVAARRGTVEITVTSGATVDRATRLVDTLFARL
ncbi:hypothetical protein ACFFSW_08325 [Saccharothrix longispora]|uniref:DUF3558 domain-containing protein n=1 Tax=Saccharothrix longispora TaxID=33920 RepID=A0ABU1Q878_9PSEU|nr:hypothetical protein [Saccharothrix longispora]MDR6598644.1 hypothetical protein [Saccharothrix longispora]